MRIASARWRHPAQITRFVENYPPGLVECRFIDRFGHEWRDVVKFYDVTDDEIGPESEYPRAGHIACEILSRGYDEAGREVAEIESDWMTSEEGVTRFHVFADQLKESPG